MDILRFVRWWWNKKSTFTRTIYIVWIWIGCLILMMFIIGLKGFLIWIGMSLLCALGIVLCKAYSAIRYQWLMFQHERDLEAQRIIAKLSGTTPPSLKDGAARLIDALRVRSWRGPKPP